ncbi:hypothetical protein D3C87_1470400 [compost metagenome]
MLEQMMILRIQRGSVSRFGCLREASGTIDFMQLEVEDGKGVGPDRSTGLIAWNPLRSQLLKALFPLLLTPDMRLKVGLTVHSR